MAAPNRCCGKSSFTLIEILVVVAVIAVLAALLLPALQSAKERTKRAVCLQHLREVGVALHMLAEDNDGWINGINAPWSVSNDVYTGVWRWPAAVAPYIGSPANTNWLGENKLLSYTENVTFCPGRRKPEYNAAMGIWVEGWYPYGVNTSFVGYQYGPMHSLREVVHASRVYLAADCYTGWPSSWLPGHFWPTVLGQWGSGVWVHPRHPISPSAPAGVYTVGSGLNFVFVDGHGEFLKQTGPGYWENEWWNYPGGIATAWPYLNTFGLGINGE